jgi:hypothetical protein
MKKVIVTILLFFAYCTVYAQPSPIITTLAGNGTPGYSGDNAPATAAQLKGPMGLAVDNAGNVYVGDLNHVIRKISPAGIITTFAGTGVSAYSGDNGPATAAEIFYSASITADKKGNIYIGDKLRIRKINAAGTITTFAGTGAGTISGDGGPATAAGIGTPGGLCSDDTGNIYVSAGGYVRRIDTFGIIHAFAGGGTVYTEGAPATAVYIDAPNQIVIDNMGNLYLIEQHNVRMINTSHVIHNIAGSGNGYYLGDNGPATAAGLNYAVGVATDRCSNIYIADSYNNRIRVVNDLGIITTFAGTGYGTDTTAGSPHFTGGYTGDGGPATAAELFLPIAICLDKHGNIYFTEANNNIVRYIHMDSCTRAVSHVAVAGPAAIKEGLAVYPNPSTGTFTVMVQSGSNEAMHITICNMVGAKVGEYDAMTNEAWQPERGMPPGVYLLHATTAHGRYVEKIVVR